MPERTTYYSGKRLVVTDAKLTHAGSTYPISAITAVRVSKLPETATEHYQRSMSIGGGAFLIGLLLVIGSIVGVLSGGSSGLPPGLILVGLGLGAWGLWTASRAWEADSEAAKRRDVCVQLASGDSFSVRASSPGKAKEIKQAIDSAITAKETRGSAPSSVAAELEKLAALRDSGAISPEDWERAKDLFLGKRPDERAEAIVQLKKLHDLHRDGVLSESEFNSKKWDILVRTA